LVPLAWEAVRLHVLDAVAARRSPGSYGESSPNYPENCGLSKLYILHIAVLLAGEVRLLGLFEVHGKFGRE
jgi:hypothetical protein